MLNKNMDEISLVNLHKELKNYSNPNNAEFLGRFFKTGKGQYAEGDVFLGGISTPIINKLVSKYKSLSLSDLDKLIQSKYHEERMTALGILKKHFEKANKNERKEIYKFYLRNTKNINNWDLVDVTADKIVGIYLIENPGEIKVLDGLVKSKVLWERRIATMTTFAFIKNKSYLKTLEFCEKLINDKEDLIHKATGWMLREIGNRDREVEEKFLKKHYKKMPRTMLRYAIEKFPEPLRLNYLYGRI